MNEHDEIKDKQGNINKTLGNFKQKINNNNTGMICEST